MYLTCERSINLTSALHIFSQIESHNLIFYGLIQIAENNQLVSEKLDITCLQKEYSIDDFVYQAKIKVCGRFC